MNKKQLLVQSIRLRSALEEMGLSMSAEISLNLLAQSYGYKDWPEVEEILKKGETVSPIEVVSMRMI